MIRVAIVTKKMVIGGTEKALLPFLAQFAPDKYETDLYVQELGGDLFDEVPPWVNIIKTPNYKDIGLEGVIKHPLHFVAAAVNRLQINNEEPYNIQCERASKCMPIVDKQYDMAIAYHAPDAVPFFYVINNLKAKKKIMWLHFDIEQTNAVNKLAESYFEKYDAVYAVSEQVKEIFDRHYPGMAGKSHVFYNLVDSASLWKKAVAAPTYDDGYTGTRILSIGRLEDPKGYDFFLPVIRRVIDDGYDARLYICGDGRQKEGLVKQIQELSLGDDVVLYGMVSNPYGYLRDCDIYVQPSRFEGYSTTTMEAKVFHRPIIVSDVCGMKEQFENGVNGSIVELTEESFIKELEALISDKEKQMRYIQNLSEQSFDNTIDVSVL